MLLYLTQDFNAETHAGQLRCAVYLKNQIADKYINNRELCLKVLAIMMAPENDALLAKPRKISS